MILINGSDFNIYAKGKHDYQTLIIEYRKLYILDSNEADGK